MQSRPNKKIADIKFTLINQNQYVKPDASVTQELERLAPAFVDQFGISWGVETAQFKVKLARDLLGRVFGYMVEVTVLLDESKQNKNKEALWPEVTAAIDAGAKALDPNATCLVFAEKNPNDFHVKHRDESTEKMLFKGKVQKRTYEYDKADATNLMGIEFVNEAESKLKQHSHQRQMTYDRWSNITSITYLYQPCVVDELRLAKLTAKAEELVNTNRKYLTFLQSIIDRNYNQALRKACAVGSEQLFGLLIDYASEDVIDLDLNEFTGAKKTALDYAYESKNEALVETLKLNGAKTYNDLKYRLAESERAEINKHNPQRPQRGMGSEGLFGANVFQQHRPTRKPEDLISRALVNQCLRTGQHFKEFVHTPMSREEMQSLEAYERQCRDKHISIYSGAETLGIFGSNSSPQHRPEPRRPQDLINPIYVDQCLSSNTPFEMFATRQMTNEEREILKAYEHKCREEYKRKQESDNKASPFGFQYHNPQRKPWDRDHDNHKNDHGSFSSFKSNSGW